MSRSSSIHASTAAVAEKPIGAKPAVKKASAPSKVKAVSLRRLGKAVGSVPSGRYILVLDANRFGSGPADKFSNWLGGEKGHFPDRETAISAARSWEPRSSTRKPSLRPLFAHARFVVVRLGRAIDGVGCSITVEAMTQHWRAQSEPDRDSSASHRLSTWPPEPIAPRPACAHWPT